MLILFYSIVLTFTFLFEIVTKKRIKNLFAILFIIYIIILMGGNTQNPDTFIYEAIYNNNTLFTKDIGFGLLVNFFKMLGFNYNWFKLIISIIGILLINSTINKYNEDHRLCYFLYLSFPFLYDVVQVRNFLAMSIMVFAIRYLVENDLKGKIKFLILIFLAVTMQKTALVYIPLIFLNRFEKTKILKIFFPIIIISSIYMGLNKSMVEMIMNNISIYFSDTLEGIDIFLKENDSTFWIIQWGVQIINFIFMQLTLNFMKIKNKDNEEQKNFKNKKIKFIKLVYNINIYLFIFLPLYVIDPTFNRIMRNIYILNYISYAVVMDYLKIEDNVANRRNIKLFMIATIVFNLMMLYIYFFMANSEGYFENIIQPIFRENWINNLF